MGAGRPARCTRVPHGPLPTGQDPGTRDWAAPVAGSVPPPTRPGPAGGLLVAKLSFLAGFGAGYVLGARAGRERYEQIRRTWSQAKDDPRLQSVAGIAQARADDVVSSLRTRMGSEPRRCSGRSVR